MWSKRWGSGVTHPFPAQEIPPPPPAHAGADAENQGLEGGREAPCLTCPPNWSSGLPLVVGASALEIATPPGRGEH